MYTARRVFTPAEPERPVAHQPMDVYDEPEPEVVRPKKSKKGRLPGVKLLRQLAAQRKAEKIREKIAALRISSVDEDEDEDEYQLSDDDSD